MSLIVVFHNDGTGDDTIAHYNVEVRINTRVLWQGRIRRHRRALGWQDLLHRLAALIPPA